MTSILEKRIVALIHDAGEGILHQMTDDTSEQVRQEAVRILTASLNPTKSRADKFILKNLPQELLHQDNLIGAIWCMETIGKLGNTVSLKTLKKILEQAIEERDKYVLLGYTEGIQDISSGTDALFQMAKNHIEISENQKRYKEFSLMMGEYQKATEQWDNAISTYTEMMNKGYVDGYGACADVYNRLGQYEKSIQVLETGYNLLEDENLLRELIFTLCKADKIPQAQKKYNELQKISTVPVAPFILYQGTIENDQELSELEELMADYIDEGTFIPSEELVQLSKSASDYIFREIKNEQKTLQEFENMNEASWDNDDREEYSQAISRKLCLIQIDLLTLGNPRSIKHYMEYMDQLGMKGNTNSRQLLADFFREHFSKEVERSMLEGARADASVDSLSLFEMISAHIGRIGELFSQPNFDGIHKTYIVPLLYTATKHNNTHTHDSAMEDNISESMRMLENRWALYNALSPDIQTQYREYLTRFDQTYGVFYRIHLQEHTNNSGISLSKHSGIIQEYPDTALFVWIQQILSEEISRNSAKKIKEIMNIYPIGSAGSIDTLFFGVLLYTISPLDAAYFLMTYPNMLQIPQAISIITSSLLVMNLEEREIYMQDITSMITKDYDGKDFFAYVRYRFEMMNNETLSSEDSKYISLANRNIALLQGKEIPAPIAHFHSESTLGEGESLLIKGAFYEKAGDFEKALKFFEETLCQEETLLTIAKILSCSLAAARFDITQRYIDYALRQGHTVPSYVLAFHLYQGNTESALLQVISVIHHQQDLIDEPEGLIELLNDTIQQTLKISKSQGEEEYKEQIFASFIQCYRGINNTKNENGNNFITHWKYIADICNIYQGEQLHTFIQSSLMPLIGIGEIDNTYTTLPFVEQTVKYIHIHAMKTYAKFEFLYEQAKEIDDKEKMKDIRTTINNFADIVLGILKKFPDVDSWYMQQFISEITFHSDNYVLPPDTFLYSVPVTIQ